MEERLYLHIPSIEELEYREKLMSQPETMNYNKGYEISFNGYNKETGCIEFKQPTWEKWYSKMVNNKPNAYYAYIMRKVDNVFIGEVNIHWNDEKKWYDMGIVLESSYRGYGYSIEALTKLINVAFQNYNAPAVHNQFEMSRKAALVAHKVVGFSEISIINGLVELLITREDYLKKNVLNE